jgi:hypothetical protein
MKNEEASQQRLDVNLDRLRGCEKIADRNPDTGQR